MQMTKKVLSVVLAVMMVVSMMTVMAVSANAATAVAKVGETNYESLEDAIAAISTVTDEYHNKSDLTIKKYKANGTIQLLADCAGNGIVIDSGSNLTIDFNGKKYSVTGDLVGSNGTETLGFQLLRDSSVTFKNGEIYSEKAKMLVMNYSNLTLDNMVLDGTKMAGDGNYVLSNNNGNVVINDTTIDARPGCIAFDVCRYASYPSVSVTVTGNSEINGNVEVYAQGGDVKDGLNLNLESGEIKGTVVENSATKAALEASTTSGITTAPGFEVYVAKIGDAKYATLAAAFEAAVDGDTITVVADCNGNGISVPQGKFGTTGLTVDFGGFTYTVDDTPLAGSPGTKSQAFQLLKDNKITFKNGTIYSELARMLVQNYSDLTLDNMILDGSQLDGTGRYTLSNNNGNVVIDDTTIIAKEGNNFAFDVCRYADYPSVNVTVTGGSVINGDVEVYASGSDAKDGFSLTLTSGTMNGDIVLTNSAKTAMANTPDKAEITKAAAFEQEAPADYKWDNNGVLVPKVYVAQVGTSKFETIGEAIAAAQDGDTIELLSNVNIGANWYRVNKDVTFDLGGYTVTGNDSFIVVGAGADVTIENGTVTSDVSGDYVLYTDGNLTIAGNATIVASAAGGSAVVVRDGGQLDVEGTITSGYYSIAGFGAAVVNVYEGASITSTDASALSGNGSNGNEGYTFNVMGGTLTSTNDVAIYHPNQGTLNITGGTITGATAIYIKSGTTDVSTSGTSITGATITGNGAVAAMVHSGNGCNATGDAIVIENCGYPGGVPDIDISGGTIVSQNAQDVGSYAYGTDAQTGVDFEPITGFVSGGSFKHEVPAEQCAAFFVPAQQDPVTGMYTVVLDDNPLNPLMVAATDVNDGNSFNIDSDYLVGTLLGYQKKDAIIDADVTSESHQETGNDIRFVAVLDTDILEGADDYGFVLAKVNGKEFGTTKFENLKAFGGNGEKTVSAKGTWNNVCGNEAYGDPTADTPYKYITCAVNGIDDGSQIVARFYVKKGDKTYYAKYAGQNYQYTGCLATLG